MPKKNIFIFSGLALALSIAALLSPFASKDPDGLDRVAQDLKFEEKATETPPTKQLPFYFLNLKLSICNRPLSLQHE